MAYLRRVENFVFLLTLFSFSVQLGKHFWPEFSFVNGIRVDYLSPTLYISDLFIALLFLFTLLRRGKLLIKSFTKSVFLPLFLLSLLVSFLFADIQQVSFVGNLKIIEMLFFGWYVSQINFSKEAFIQMIDILVVAGVVQSVIALFQFFLQHSIGGFIYFLGERTFTANTIGIATFFTNGHELLRPYGTFPHPNVLAFFLAIVILFALSFSLSKKSSLRLVLYSISLIFLVAALLLTFSRSIIFLTFLSSSLLFLKSKKILLVFVPVIFLIIVCYILLFLERFTFSSLVSAYGMRIFLFEVSWRAFWDNIWSGVGVNNVFFNSNRTTLPLYVRFQPVHNIYLHILVQLGALGGITSFVFLYNVLRKSIFVFNRGFHKKFFPQFPIALLSIMLLLVGLIDHFPVTLQQGQLMGAFIIGLIFNKVYGDGVGDRGGAQVTQ